MNSLKDYVDELFRKYTADKEINELKAEIWGNLEARKADLMKSGMDETVATEQAKLSITHIDELIDGNKNVYIRRLEVESLQQALLNLVIAWVITIPATIFRGTILVGGLLFLAVIIVGILYLTRYRDMDKNRDDFKQRQYVNINYFIKLKKTIWLWWGVFAALSIVLVTGANFGSNIWFSRPIHINGPYMFATILVQYLLPLFSIVIPLTFHSIPKLITKNEADK